MLRKCLFAIFFIFLCIIVESKLPEIDSFDVTNKLSEIMKVHANYKRIDEALMRRILRNFLEELDPTKIYFTKNEIAYWLEPSDSLLVDTVNKFMKSDFSAFEEMHRLMIKAIKRRKNWENDLENHELLEKIDRKEFKDLDWALSEEDLFLRLVKLKILQNEAIEKLDEKEYRERSLQRIRKQRLNREEDLMTEDPTEKKRRILSYILKAGAAALDNHTAYFTPGEATQFMINVQQRLFGIGAQLRDDLNGFTIVKIIKGGPAYKGKKLKEKDRVIAVNGEPVVGMEILEAVELIRGENETPVVLTVLREGQGEEEKLDIEITRGEVVLEDTRMQSSYEPYGNGVIAQIKLFSFYQDPLSSSAADILKEIEKMKKEHPLKGIILDLRYNSGGVLHQAVEVAGLFISKGIVVSLKDGAGNIQHHRDSDGKAAWGGPLIILTNRLSASAAEIVAQSLQDYGVGIVVGDDFTFGKGTYQTFTLDSSRQGFANPEGEYKVTVGKYYTVSGKSPQLKGVAADIVVPGVFSKMDVGERFSKFPLE